MIFALTDIGEREKPINPNSIKNPYGSLAT